MRPMEPAFIKWGFPAPVFSSRQDSAPDGSSAESEPVVQPSPRRWTCGKDGKKHHKLGGSMSSWHEIFWLTYVKPC